MTNFTSECKKIVEREKQPGYWLKNKVNLVASLFTAIVGYSIHGSIFFSIVNFFFWPISLVVWILGHDITYDVLKNAFGWFFN